MPAFRDIHSNESAKLIWRLPTKIVGVNTLVRIIVVDELEHLA
jgi:hypothetical protein